MQDSKNIYVQNPKILHLITESQPNDRIKIATLDGTRVFDVKISKSNDKLSERVYTKGKLHCPKDVFLLLHSYSNSIVECCRQHNRISEIKNRQQNHELILFVFLNFFHNCSQLT